LERFLVRFLWTFFEFVDAGAGLFGLFELLVVRAEVLRIGGVRVLFLFGVF